jgi:hypothetical protein
MPTLTTQTAVMQLEAMLFGYSINQCVASSTARLVRFQLDAMQHEIADESASLRRIANSPDFGNLVAALSDRAAKRKDRWSMYYLKLMFLAGQFSEDIVRAMPAKAPTGSR